MWVLLAIFLAQAVDFSAEGQKALDAQKYDAAVELFKKAVAEDPKDYGPRFNLALAYSLLGKDAESIPQYKAVLELKPGLYEAELNLGISLLRAKDAAGAVVQLKAAAEQNLRVSVIPTAAEGTGVSGSTASLSTALLSTACAISFA